MYIYVRTQWIHVFIYYDLYMGVSSTGGTPISHPKMIIFSRKTNGCLGNSHWIYCIWHVFNHLLGNVKAEGFEPINIFHGYPCNGISPSSSRCFVKIEIQQAFWGTKREKNPKFNIPPLKNDSWKMSFLLGLPIFRGELWNFRDASQNRCIYPHVNIIRMMDSGSTNS